MRRFLGVGALAWLLLVPAASQAATITVGSSLDTGVGCTLRSAITSANTDTAAGGCIKGDSGLDTINFSLPAGSKITLGSALPNITSAINIVGPGSGQLTIDGANMFHPLFVTGSQPDAISGLTVTHGLSSTGGAIENLGSLTLTDVVVSASTASQTGGTSAAAEGGGIWNSGTLHLILSTVTNNTASASGASSQDFAEGGGIFNQGSATLTLDRSSVSGNQATAAGGGVSAGTTASGGGIHTFSGGTLSITQSTISGNTSTGTGGTGANSAHGGGIEVGSGFNTTFSLARTTVTGNSISAGSPTGSLSGGGIDANGLTGSVVTVVSSTISRNSAPAGGSNLVPGGATRSIENTIVSNPLGGSVNCGSTNTGSQGFNLDDGTSCGFTQSGDHQSTNPLLAASLADNGGPTQTLALLPGSPAIDQGVNSAGETTDQRGLPRPSDFGAIPNATGGNGTDIGAFELQDTTPPDTSLSARLRKLKHKAKFEFTSTEPGSSFLCKFDKRPFAPCSSPDVFKHLRRGKHTFSVEARDLAGNVDPSPATFSFKLKH